MPAPRADEVLVRVHASSVTSGDARLRAFRGAGIFWLPMRLLFGVLRPRNPVPGTEFAGIVAAVGNGVTRFRIGDAVFGMRIGGANAEYVAIPEGGAILAMPGGLGFEEAAATPFGALSALAFLRDFAHLRAGQRILIHGASGAVGVFAIQLARQFGAHVTGVCSAANLGLVRSLGADAVIDYATTDFTAGQEAYDVILDTVGGTSVSRSRRVLAPAGRHVFLVHGARELLWALWTRLRGGQRVVCGIAGGDSRRDLSVIARLLEAGRIRPVIDRTYAMEAIAAAHAHVDTGRKRGAVVITVHAEEP